MDNLRDGTALGSHFLPVYALEGLRILHHALRNPRLSQLDEANGRAFLLLASELVDAAASHLPHYKDPSQPAESAHPARTRERRWRR